MKRLIGASLLALTAAAAVAQEAPAAKPAAEISRKFSAQDVAIIGALCDMATWANRMNAEGPCRALMQRLARTPADDALELPSPAKE